MDFQAQKKSLLRRELAELNEGEAIATLPFAYAKSLGNEFGCNYFRMLEGTKHYVFLKDGGIRPDVIKPWIYQGETFVSSKQGFNHYLRPLLEDKLNQGELSFESAFTANKPHMDDWLSQGHSPMITPKLAYDTSRSVWARFIQEYLEESSYKTTLPSFLQVLAIHSGKLFAPSKISAECKKLELKRFDTPTKVLRATARLQSMGVWNLIEPVTGLTVKPSRPVSKKAVGFFFDCGFLAYLLRRKRYIPDDSKLKQSLFWHLVANDILRELSVEFLDTQIMHYWRPPSELPILVLKHKGRMFPITINYENNGAYFFKHMGYIAEFKSRPQLMITARGEPWNKVQNRITLPFDTAVKSDWF